MHDANAKDRYRVLGKTLPYAGDRLSENTSILGSSELPRQKLSMQ